MSETPPPRTVLVVEDDPSLLRLHRQSLSRAGYRVLTATNGLEALSLARKERPDLVLLDVQLPTLSGFEVARLLKFDAKYRAIPIVMLTALGETADEKTGYETGADRYLVKPVPYAQLLEVIRALLDGKKSTA